MPVVLKAEQPGLIHKSDRGGVRLGLATDRRRELKPMTRLPAVSARPRRSLQRQAAPGLELVLGARRDANFGPVVMAGLGGIWVEALGDVALRLAPLDEDRGARPCSTN